MISTKLSPQKIAERTIPSVALIRTAGGVGTGFVVRADGRIATNLHVISGVRDATVVVGEKEYDDVEVVATDNVHDLAVLKVAAKGLPVLQLGDSNAVKPGQEVVAIGHPLGLGNTVSNGLVSAVREIEPGLKMLQVSAPISPGSSGGPLLGERGEVIGLSTLVVASGQNLNFGMPVNYLKALLQLPEKPSTLAELADRTAKAAIKRSVPHHELDLVSDCTNDDLTQIERAIGQAIGVGAPLYNEGNHEACFKVYEATVLALDKNVKRCTKVRKALVAGVTRAEKLETHTEKAWALRDAFDGVLDVIGRKLGEGAPIGETSAGKNLLVRQVPDHEVALLKGCSADALVSIERGIGEAIDVGAPLYNQGNAEACFRIYQGAALELTRSLQRCVGPKRALKDGLARANKAASYEAKAWAMRDAFDGLLKVISRKHGE